jgi:hypothetical protein
MSLTGNLTHTFNLKEKGGQEIPFRMSSEKVRLQREVTYTAEASTSLIF